MKREFFTENISVETIAVLTDEMLNFERTAKQRNLRANILKIAPAIAAIILVIGLVNLMPMFIINNSEFTPGAVIRDNRDVSEYRLTNIPRIIEPSVFESLLENFPTEHVGYNRWSVAGNMDMNLPNLPDWTAHEWRLWLSRLLTGARSIYSTRTRASVR
jgi:hypothetical protein